MFAEHPEIDPISPLAEEFVTRHRRGERPEVEDYAARHPELAERIRALFPTLLLMEQSVTIDGQMGSSPSIAPLERVGGYRILREVGRGGMGVVYEAEQESLDRRVALKVLPLHAAGDGQAQERFRREARAAARLHHNNIVPVYEVGEENGLCFYAMQFIHGQPLDAVIEELKKARLSGSSITLPGSDPSSATNRRPFYRSVAHIGTQAAEALDYAHREGVIHRDIKPSNLLLDAEGRVWVTDFGLAKVEGSSLTQTGDVVGTLRYVPPERFNGWTDPRSDVYSLGLTLYELLALRPAFEAPDPFKLIQQVIHDEPSRLRTVDDTLPPDLETIVAKAIDKEPSRRYQTAADLAADLTRFHNDQPIHARRITSYERLHRWARRNKSLAVALAAVALLTLAVTLTSLIAAVRFRDLAEENRRSLYVAVMRQAGDAAQKSGGRQRLRQLLDDVQPRPGEKDLRGWEWHYLNSLLGRPEEARSFQAHDGPILWASWHPKDGRRLATAGRDIRIWDVSQSRLIRTLHGHSQSVASVAWSADGTKLASGGLDGTLCIWDVNGERLLHALRTDSGSPIRSVSWHPDGRQLVVATYDLKLTVWDAVLGVPVRNLSGSRNALFQANWSPDGKRVVACGRGTEIHDLSDKGDPQNESPPRHLFANGWVLGAIWSPDGGRLATLIWGVNARPSQVVKIWNAETGAELMTIAGRDQPTRAPESPVLNWSPDGKRLLLLDGEALEVRDAESGVVLETLPDPEHPITWAEWNVDGQWLACADAAGFVTLHPGTVGVAPRSLAQGYRSSALAWAPDNRRLALGGLNGDLEIDDIREGIRVRSLPGHPNTILAVGWSPDGSALASAGEGGDVRIWDCASGKLRQILRGRPTLVRVVRWSRDGTRLATLGDDGLLELWEVASGEKLQTLGGHTAGQSLSVDWNPDGTLVATTGFVHGGVRVWDVASGQEIPKLRIVGNPDEFDCVCWSADGRLAVSVGRDQIQTWERHEEGWVRSWSGRMAGSSPVNQVQWSPDGKRLYALGRNSLSNWDAVTGVAAPPVHFVESGEAGPKQLSPDGRLVVETDTVGGIACWDAVTGKLLERWPGRRRAGHVVGWSPDGDRLAVAVRDVRIMDLKSGKSRYLKGHAENVFGLCWSPDGKRMGTSGLDDTVRIWDAETAQELRVLRGHTGNVWCVDWHPRDNRVVSASEDGTVRLWNAATGEAVGSFDGQRGVRTQARWSFDGERLAWAGSGPDYAVCVGKPEPGTPPVRLTGHATPISVVCWNPKSKRLASADTLGTIKVWDVRRETELYTLHSPSAKVYSLSWSPDGSRLASGDGDGVRIWDAERGVELIALQLLWPGAFSVAWHKDGKRLAVMEQILDADNQSPQRFRNLEDR